jgi:hypothetical protein
MLETEWVQRHVSLPNEANAFMDASKPASSDAAQSNVAGDVDHMIPATQTGSVLVESPDASAAAASSDTEPVLAPTPASGAASAAETSASAADAAAANTIAEALDSHQHVSGMPGFVSSSSSVTADAHDASAIVADDTVPRADTAAKDASGMPEHGLHHLQLQLQHQQQRDADAQHHQMRQKQAEITQHIVNSLSTLPATAGRSVYCTQYNNG